MKDPIASTFRKILYFFLPVILAILTFFIGFEMKEFPWIWWGFIAILFLGSYFLDKGKVFGMIPGILLGICVILDDFKPPRVGPSVRWIGIALIVFYLICGFFVLFQKRKNKDN